ncbi:hypothetical protein [Turicimonas muris]|nr:hypothetical protein [Turicimonas muris]
MAEAKHSKYRPSYFSCDIPLVCCHSSDYLLVKATKENYSLSGFLG